MKVFAPMRAKVIYLLKATARRLRWGPSDLLRRRRSGPLVPPRSLSFVGAGDFVATGHQFRGYFAELGGLRPGHRVLDVGCGVGRMALPLVDYLDGGSYAGFDNGREMVRWCQRNISPLHPNFEFVWAPVYNAKYNPFGQLSAAEYRFPYEDGSFDFAFATSVFTHLLRDDADHYLAEVSRVLRPGGTCLLTWFLLTPEAERELAAGNAMLPFRHPVDGGLTTDPRCPEEAIAYREELVVERLHAVGLTVRQPVHRGLWAQAPDGLTLQDVVVAQRA